MTLSQRDTNTAAFVAALFVQGKTKEELSHFAQELSAPVKRHEAVTSLCEMVANSRGVKVEEVNVELAEEILRRILTNTRLRFPDLSPWPEPPPSEEIDALCET